MMLVLGCLSFQFPLALVHVIKFYVFFFFFFFFLYVSLFTSKHRFMVFFKGCDIVIMIVNN
jgi:hypothetical protein